MVVIFNELSYFELWISLIQENKGLVYMNEKLCMGNVSCKYLIGLVRRLICVWLKWIFYILFFFKF